MFNTGDYVFGTVDVANVQIRVVEAFAEKMGLTLDAALDFFYHSETCCLISEGVSNPHCMSDAY